MACCVNCGAPLGGPYCSACGQRVEPRIQPLAHFARDAFEIATHSDSRLWRTLLPLLLRPGYLTVEFLRGRRAAYLPPFRLYLVITLLFFLLVATLGVTDSGPIRIAGAGPGDSVVAPVVLGAPGADVAAAQRKIEAERARVNAEFAELERRISAAKTPAERALLERGLQVVTAARTGIAEPAAASADRCQIEAADWIEPRLEAACRKVIADQGRGLGAKFLENVPKAMFLFLPFLALVMKAMYRRPKRYYVEHLLFLIHNHAFAFLFFGLYLLASLVVPRVAAEPLGLAVFVGLFWYFFRSMRRVYAEGRLRTFAKFTVLGFTYFVSGAVMLLLTAFVSAVSL